ncbi:peptidase inhibitor family I36 protein [Amycolatopsis sp. NBC_00438]|uniref:peptidase inhibitor family I36 protein n=1 Tax=Amycolatopsis sp. NBC_00438 TaxID=2903558 RepID=UPI002E1F22F3
MALSILEETLGPVGKRLAQALLAVGGGIALLATVAPAANAATARNGVCEAGEFCLYYGYGFSGSVSDFSGRVPNYGSTQPGCYEFKGPGEGKGQCVKNNARSAKNKTSIWVVKVYFNSNYGGRNFTFNPGGEGDLGSLARENASHDYELVS